MFSKIKLLVVHFLGKEKTKVREGCSKMSSPKLAEFVEFFRNSRCDCGSDPPFPRAEGQDDGTLHKFSQVRFPLQVF